MKTYRGRTPEAWVEAHENFSSPAPCEYGHLGCSCSEEEGGPCYDEMLSATLSAWTCVQCGDDADATGWCQKCWRREPR